MYKFAAILVFVIVMKDVTAFDDFQRIEAQTFLYKSGLECYRDYPIKEEELTMLSQKQFPDGVNTGCFTACVFKKAGIFDSQGYLSETSALEHAKQIVKDENQLMELGKIFNACSGVNDVPSDDQGCQRAGPAYNCLMEKARESGYVV